MAYAYITNLSSNIVSVIDTVTNTVLPTTITVGNSPFGVASLPNWRYVYITNNGEFPGTVSVIDKLTNTTVGLPVTVENGPQGIALSPNGAFVYVANIFSNTVSVIDTQQNNAVSKLADIPFSPNGIAVSPDGRYVYVSTSAQVYEIDTAIPNPTPQAIGDPLTLGGFGIAVTPDGQYVYVAAQPQDKVHIIDTITKTQYFEIDINNPAGIAISPDGHYVYITTASDNRVYVIDNTTTPPSVADILDIGDGSVPTGISIIPNGKFIYVANQGSLGGNSVSIIERNNNTHTVLSPPITGGFNTPYSFGMFITCSSIITLSPSTLPNGTVGTLYNQTITQTGGTGTITWSSTGNLPSGLTLNTSTGRISGTPATSGPYFFTLQAEEDNSGCSGTQAYTIEINTNPTPPSPPSPPSNNERQRLLRELQRIRLQLQNINRKLRLLSRRKKQLLLQRSNLIAACKELSEGIATNCQKCRNQAKQIACLERLNNLTQKINRIINIQKSLLRQRKNLKRREQRIKRELQLLT